MGWGGRIASDQRVKPTALQPWRMERALLLRLTAGHGALSALHQVGYSDDVLATSHRIERPSILDQ